MNKTVSDLRKILGRVAKDGKQIAKSQMEECIIALSDAVCASDKRLGLKIVGKPYEGKPHARFDEGPLGRLYSRTSGLLYSVTDRLMIILSQLSTMIAGSFYNIINSQTP